MSLCRYKDRYGELTTDGVVWKRKTGMPHAKPQRTQSSDPEWPKSDCDYRSACNADAVQSKGKYENEFSICPIG